MADVKAIAETLVNLTVKEVQELATVLKDEYGIEPAAAAVVVAGGGAGAGDAAAAKTSFDVILVDAGAAKLGVVKVVKDLTGLGLNIVAKYVELLNGNIDFDSKLNFGTTFIITIPNNNIAE